MPVRVSQVRREYPNFPGQQVNYLAANIDNWVKTSFQIQCYSLVETSGDNPLYITCTGPGRTIIRRVNGTWADEGIVVGSMVYLSIDIQDLAPSSPTVSRTWNAGDPGGTPAGSFREVNFVSPDGLTIEVLGSVNGDGSGLDYLGENKLFPSDRQQDFRSGYLKAYVYRDVAFEGIELFYNMVANTDKQNQDLNSILDGSQSRFTFDALDTTNPASFFLNQLGFKSGSSIDSVKVRAQPNGGNPSGRYNIPNTPLPDIDGNPSGQRVQPGQVLSIYVVEIIHKIYGIEEDVNGFENGEIPEWFNDTNALTDLVLFKVFETFGNQNVFIASDLQSSVVAVNSNTGYIGEVFNGGTPNKSIESVEFQNLLGTPIDSLDYGNETRVNVLINNPDHDNDTVYEFNFQYLPNDSEQYYEKTTSYINNTIQNTPLKSNAFDGVDLTGLFSEGFIFPTFQGEQHPSGARMDLKQLEIFQTLAPGIVLVTFKLEPNNEFFSYMDDQAEDNRRFIITLNANQKNVPLNTSSSQVIAFGGNMEFVPIPAGPFPGMSNLFNELPVHPNQNGAAVCIGFPEDLWLARVQFDQDVAAGITFKSIKPTIELFNTVTGQVAELDSAEINLESQIIDQNGTQQNQVFGSRGFLTISTHDKNFLNVFRDPSSDVPPLYRNVLEFGFRIRHEYWIENGNIPTALFDALEPNNGLNNYWHWLEQGDWVPQLAIYLTVDRAGTEVLYKNTFPMEMRDYFEVLDITPECRHYDEQTGASLYQGVDDDGLDCNTILGTGLTRIEQDYVLNTGIFPTSGIYAECNLEVWEGAGFKSIRTLSTEYQGEVDNPLKPTGNNGNLLELVLVAPDRLRAICLIDPSFIQGAATEFKISGRIGCSSGNKLPTLPPEGLYTDEYDTKYL